MVPVVVRGATYHLQCHNHDHSYCIRRSLRKKGVNLLKRPQKSSHLPTLWPPQVAPVSETVAKIIDEALTAESNVIQVRPNRFY